MFCANFIFQTLSSVSDLIYSKQKIDTTVVVADRLSLIGDVNLICLIYSYRLSIQFDIFSFRAICNVNIHI